MDPLAASAYAATVAGLAGLFLTPVITLILMPAGFIMGLIALMGRRDRFKKRRGRGLAIAAVALGGAFSLLIVGSLIILGLFGF